MRTCNLISFIIMSIGGLNWLSVGIFQFDIIASIFGSSANVVSRVLYILVGIATLYLIYVAIVERGRIKMMPNDDRDYKTVKSVNN